MNAMQIKSLIERLGPDPIVRGKLEFLRYD